MATKMSACQFNQHTQAEPHRLCPYCRRDHTEVVTDTFTGWGGVEQPPSSVRRRCTNPMCKGRAAGGWIKTQIRSPAVRHDVGSASRRSSAPTLLASWRGLARRDVVNLDHLVGRESAAVGAVGEFNEDAMAVGIADPVDVRDYPR